MTVYIVAISSVYRSTQNFSSSLWHNAPYKEIWFNRAPSASLCHFFRGSTGWSHPYKISKNMTVIWFSHLFMIVQKKWDHTHRNLVLLMLCPYDVEYGCDVEFTELQPFGEENKMPQWWDIWSSWSINWTWPYPSCWDKYSKILD